MPRANYQPPVSCLRCRKVVRVGGPLVTHLGSCTPDRKESLFWSKVEKRDGCWGWTAQKRWDGYGRFRHENKAVFAHRYSYELHHGPIPQGMCVMHICDNPECTNPAHLRLGTHVENMAEMAAKGRGSLGERSGQAKLTEAQVREIRALYKKTGPRRGNGTELARRFGVSPGSISEIANGRRWEHVK